MKKILLTSLFALMAGTFSLTAEAKEAEPIVTIEIPASSIETIDVKYDKPQTSKTSKMFETTKDATDKTISATKKTTKKAVKSTKDITDKTVNATKSGYKKTVDATKEFTDKTVEGAKEALDNINPNKPVTLEELQYESQIKILKNERKGLKSAYNSRIKDVNAKLKAAEKSTILTSVQKQNKVYTLNKEKYELIKQRDAAIQKYDKKIAEIKLKNK